MSGKTIVVSPSKPVTQHRKALNMRWFKGVIISFAAAIALTGLVYGFYLADKWKTTRNAITVSIVCHSNNTKIYEGETTKGSLVIGSGYWSFQDATGHEMHVSGNCVAREQ